MRHDTEFQTEFQELLKHYGDISESLGRIETQTKLTNGRVSKCEENISALQSERSGNKGGLKVLVWASSIIFALISVIYVLYTSGISAQITDMKKTDSRIETKIDGHIQTK